MRGVILVRYSFILKPLFHSRLATILNLVSTIVYNSKNRKSIRCICQHHIESEEPTNSNFHFLHEGIEFIRLFFNIAYDQI